MQLSVAAQAKNKQNFNLNSESWVWILLFWLKYKLPLKVVTILNQSTSYADYSTKPFIFENSLLNFKIIWNVKYGPFQHIAAKMNCFPSAVAENQISQEVEAINYKFP